jgi:hypothetical protein
MPKEPLRLFLLAHPKSAACQSLAVSLMRRFVDPPATAGLRIPVRLTPERGNDLPPEWDGIDGINLDAADHTLVVVLADSRMVRTVFGGTGQQWTQFFQEGVKRAAAASGSHYVLGIAADSAGFNIASSQHMVRIAHDCPALTGNTEHDDHVVSEWLKNVVDDAALQITVQAIRKLEPRVQPTEGRAPLQLFLSHAKADLSADTRDPVRFVEDDVKELPIDYWFDAAEIPPSADFEEEIAKGIRDCSIVVSFLTDHYSSRSWCQREVLDAKRLGVPVLVVDALDEGEPRHFPYIGNVPVVHWRADDPKLEARRVVSHAARETLRYMHNRAKLARYALTAGTTALAAAPEALTLAHCCTASANRNFVYPDPPLGCQELSVLRTLVPDAGFTTPLTMLAHGTRMDGRVVAVSISNSDDLAAHGLCEYHEQTLADEICLYLLLADCQIAYGGSLNPQIQAASNFTLRLFELVRAYSSLAQAASGKGLHPIVNYAPWPLRLSYNDQILNLFGNVATLKDGSRPAEIAEEDDALFPIEGDGKRSLDASTPLKRLAWARGLTAMRTQMTQEITARVVIGGRVDRFAGIYPGIVEEAWLALAAGKPLFLNGAFGGAARMLIDTVSSGSPKAILGCMQSSQITESVEIAKARGTSLVDTGATQSGLPDSQTLILGEKMALDFSLVGKTGVAASLKNGLSDDENEQLFYTSEPEEIARLVLTGLSRLPST